MEEGNRFIDWLPLLIAIVSIVGGAIIYQIQKATDRKNQILQERRELYRRLVVAVRELPRALIYEEKSDIAVEQVKIWGLLGELLVCAPDNVVEKCEALEAAIDKAILARFENELDDYAKTGHIYFGEIIEALNDAVYEMRIDTFGDSTITKQAISAMLSGFEISIGLRLP